MERVCLPLSEGAPGQFSLVWHLDRPLFFPAELDRSVSDIPLRPGPAPDSAASASLLVYVGPKKTIYDAPDLRDPPPARPIRPRMSS